MIESRRQGWIGLGVIVAVTGIGAVLSRVLEGGGVPIAAANPSRRRRAREPVSLEREIRACQRMALRESRPATFRRKDEGVKALLDANPEVAELLESECAQGCRDFKKWTKGGRRGPKPIGHVDGRFDAFNQRLNLRGRRRVSNWLEGVHAIVPSSRRWEDFPDRTWILEEATGRQVHAPAETDRVVYARQAAARCEDLEPLELEAAPF